MPSKTFIDQQTFGVQVITGGTPPPGGGGGAPPPSGGGNAALCASLLQQVQALQAQQDQLRLQWAAMGCAGDQQAPACLAIMAQIVQIGNQISAIYQQMNALGC
jgi:hypothetical protein